MKPILVFIFTAGLALLAFAIFPSSVRAQSSNSIPFISEPLVPDATAPGGAGFALTVNGTGFVSGATVYWNGTPLQTAFVTASKLTASVPASDVSVTGTASVDVVNSAPGGAKSNTAFFEVTPAVVSDFVNATGSPVGVGSAVLGIAMGDFNGDGILDLAAADGLANTVTILLGNGDGTFTQASGSPIPVAGVPDAIAVGDFNGDGRLDLAVAGNNGNDVVILLGNGDGTFQPPVDYPVGGTPWSVAVGDFNGDGKLDLAVADATGDEVSILLGNGNGTFQPAVQYAAGSGPDYLAVGDFNGDGRLDLAVADASGAITVLLGNGDGTFSQTPSSPVAVAGAAEALSAGDFNGDGKLDLAVAGVNSGGGGNVTILLGNGDGTFTQAPSSPIAMAGGPQGISAEDFNGDGKLDLAVESEPLSDRSISILYGNGDGSFQPPLSYGPVSSASHHSMVVGDFNRDGKLDLAVSDENYADVSIVLQSPAGLSVAGLAFGDELVGTTSPTKTVNLANNGSAPLTISNLGVTGGASSFALDTSGTTCSVSAPVASRGSCAISVSFAPTAEGSLAGTLTINDNASGSPQAVSLTGTGIAPVVDLSPPSLSFSSQTVGSTSSPQVVTLSNTGNAALTVTSISVSTNFTETNNCGASVAAGADCAISVAFAPTAAGTLTGTISIGDNASGGTQTVSLSGTGLNGPAVTLSPTNLAFASQEVGTTSAAKSITLTNLGNAPLNVTGISVSGDFTETTSCGATVAAGTSCTIDVGFVPAAASSRTGTLSVADNAMGSPQTVGLSGTGADFSVAVQSGTSSTATVTAGGSATYLLSATPLGGFNGTVSVGCTGAPSEVTCTASPASVTLNGSSAQTVSINVNTTAASLLIPTGPVLSPPTNRLVWLWVLIALVLMMLASTYARRAGRPSPALWPGVRVRRMALAAILLCAAAFAACGGGGGSSSSNAQTNAGTPTGTYTLTVTGNSGSLSHSTSLTLNVQ